MQSGIIGKEQMGQRNDICGLHKRQVNAWYLWRSTTIVGLYAINDSALHSNKGNKHSFNKLGKILKSILEQTEATQLKQHKWGILQKRQQ